MTNDQLRTLQAVFLRSLSVPLCPHAAGARENRPASWIDERGRKQEPALSSYERSMERASPAIYQGVRHAAWPEDKHESASKETICWRLTAATIECAAPRATGFSQREKKL
jgi:hypothetical protein